MKGRIVLVAIGSFIGMLLLCLAGSWYYTNSQAFMKLAGRTVSEQATELLGTDVRTGAVRIDSLHALTIEDVTLYDKTGEELVQAASVKVKFSLLSLFQKSPVQAVDEVTVRTVSAKLVQREDGSWNYEDLIQKQGQGSEFHGVVLIEDGILDGRMAGKEVTLGNVQASLNFKEQPVVAVKASFQHHEAAVQLSGRLGGTRQTISAEGKDFDLKNYLEFLPAGTLPDTVELEDGKIHKLSLAVVNDNGEVSFNGKAEFSNGRFKVMGTEINEVAGLANFTEKDATIFVHAKAEEQAASVHGKVRWDTGEPYMNLVAESENFDPGQILKHSPYQGAAAFSATICGTMDNPQVEGEFKVASGSLYGYSFRKANAKVRYSDQRIAVEHFQAEAFDGYLQGEGEFYTTDLSYNAHIKVDHVDASAAGQFLPGTIGRFTADLGIHGRGNDLDQLIVYGSASAADIQYQGLQVSKMDASFCKQGPSITLDYLSLGFPEGGTLGVEGTIQDGSKLDLAFYGDRVNLAKIAQLVPAADVSGYADFKGSVHGDLSDPVLQAEFSAIDGKLFQQPYKSLRGSAGGSLHGVKIDSFSMENGDHETWIAKGTVGFTGARQLDLQIDTVGARMEDVAALVAPDQPITGNIDNTIRITGTMDQPYAIGYIHFYSGSYRGLVLSGMDGDYTLQNGILNVHDFHIFSPMVDMDLNGTITQDKELNLKVAAHDIQLERMGSKLPYPVSGHAKFEGQIGGSFSEPVFHGELNSEKMIFNGQPVNQAQGTITYQGHVIRADDFSFEQNGGRYRMDLLANTDTRMLRGKVLVNKADVNAMLAMFNLKNNILTGRIDGQIDLSGTMENPAAQLKATIQDGAIKEYPIQGVQMDLSLSDRVLAINEFRGMQGTGLFAVQGTVNLDGNIDARVSAKDIPAGMLTKSAGLEQDVKGTVSVEAQLGGTVNNPAADVSLDVRGGGIGTSTFDSLTGLLNLKDGIIQVNQVIVQKQVDKEIYKARMYGTVPLPALRAGEGDTLDDYEQFNLKVSLDDADLNILPILSKQVEWAVGQTDGNLTITGTVAHPLVQGELSLPQGALKLKSLKLPVTNMQALVHFSGNQMTIEKCSGKMGKGTYSLTGSTCFSGKGFYQYEFGLQADKLDLECPFYRGPLSGELYLTEGELFHKRLPKLSGNVFIDNAMISIPAIPDSKGELPAVLLDFDVNLGKKVHFFSASLYDMRLAGSAHFGGITLHPQTSGTISVLRGTVTYNNTVFKIREGDAAFNQVDSFLPSITLRADAKLMEAKIYLSIDGPVNEMNVHLTSSPEMSETEILKFLTFRNAGNKKQDTDMDVSSLVNVGLQMSFLGNLENTMRDVLSLDEFSIAGETVTSTGATAKRNTADSNTHEVYNMEMGKYLNDKLMLKYKQGLGYSGYHYGIQYDLNNRMSLTFDRAQDSAYTYGIEARIKF